MEAVIFDLDDTLVDTATIRHHREARRWPQALAGVSATRIYDGIAHALAGLAERGVRVAIVTTSPGHYARRVLEHHGIGYAALIAYHDAKPKPAPDPCRLALERLGVLAENAIGVGDAYKDAASYRAAGIRAYAAGWSAATVYDAPWDGKFVAPADLLMLPHRRTR
ncbi:HAD family hydrolase [Sorangium sp. So ce233]|uniref:HAD family hydrolase n=1 Tax=Sorangium sp. So ce233 TaxID=3133290 RepID=UPI003F60546C